LSAPNEEKLARLQAIFTALLKHRLGESLQRVETALVRWRGGEMGPFEAHAELLKHVARSERLATAIARTEPDGAAPVLRDAYDAGLMELDEFRELTGVEPDEIERAPELEELDVPQLPPKREFIGKLLDDGPVLVHIDPRHDDVSVPEHLRADPRLVLRFGYGLAPAIVDLTLDKSGLSGTLTFGGVPHHCLLPWPSVYAAVSEYSQEAMVWPDDVPPEVLEQMTRQAEHDAASQSAKEAAPEPSPEPKPKRRASHLKLVD
jgi:stringent starvation protein B